MLLDCTSKRHVRYFLLVTSGKLGTHNFLAPSNRQVMVRNLRVLRTFLLALLSFLTGTIRRGLAVKLLMFELEEKVYYSLCLYLNKYTPLL